MSQRPPLIALSYFEVAARSKSFALAARELNVTPAAISHQIKALEDYLGVDLFVRHHRRVSLTPAARAALPDLQEGFQTLAQAVDKIRLHSEQGKVITVCSEPLFATKWIVPRLHRFYARFPEAEVRLQASLHSVDQARGSGFGLAHMKRAGIDVSVRLGYGDYKGLEVQQLMPLELVPMCKPGLVSTARDMALLKDNPLLCDGTLAHFEDLCGWRAWLRQQGLEDARAFRTLRFGNGLLTLEAALAGQGLLLGSQDLLSPELDAGKLEVAMEQPMRCEQAYFVVSADSGNERPIAREFREWLLGEVDGPEAASAAGGNCERA